MPGRKWADLFYTRHTEVLTHTFCESIKRAAVTPETMNLYFDNVREVLGDISSEPIFSYDESCFVDDPRRKNKNTSSGT